MRYTSSIFAVALLAACTGPVPEDEDVSFEASALTSTDVDVPPECDGILTFANDATFETLDLYLPSNTALNIVNARPFTTLEGLSAVSGVGAVRLTQIHQGATDLGYIDGTCVGIYDELAVSYDDEVAMVGLINSISDTELHDIMPNAWLGAVNILATRPYTTALEISNTSGVGPVSFRSIRNAATLSVPFETLAAAVNALDREARIERHFDWWQELNTALYAYYQGGATCFGIDPDYLPNGTNIRTDLATPAEVLSQVSYAVTRANRFNELTIDPTIGMDNLEEQLQGKTFFGCYVSYAQDPWSGNNLRFFVDPVTGFSVLSETWWSE